MEDRIDELARALSEYLHEATSKVRAERAANNPQRTRWQAFWAWWAAHATALSTMIAVLSVVAGGTWTLHQYFEQEADRVAQRAKDAELQRKTAVVNFAMALSDHAKRSGAAYAMGVLAGADAVPLLLHHLQSPEARDDADFRRAIGQTLFSIGDGALAGVLDLNRRRAAQGWVPLDAVLEGTTHVIQLFLGAHSRVLQRSHARTHGAHGPHAGMRGVVLIAPSLSYMELPNTDFEGTRFSKANLCSAKLPRASLRDARFDNDSQLGSIDLTKATLDGVTLVGVELTGAKLDGATGERVRLREARLDSASLMSTSLPSADWSGARLEAADLSGSRLDRGDFTACDLYRAKLVNASLSDASFLGADLEAADFSGADLNGARFRMSESSKPFRPDMPWAERLSAGARVLNASFKGAKNLDAASARYLCAHRALHVPGGCAGIAVELVPPIDRSMMSSSSCF